MERYIEALQRLPERHLTLIDLAWKFTRPDGTLDEDLMSFHMKEIQEAAKEAQAYASDTKKAVSLLCRLQHSQP